MTYPGFSFAPLTYDEEGEETRKEERREKGKLGGTEERRRKDVTEEWMQVTRKCDRGTMVKGTHVT